jgi:single-strand DNA-binding protein
MASFNRVILVGNLTRDPELRYTPKGMAIAKIGLAVNRTWRNEAGETKEDVTFVDVDAFGRQAETLAQYMKKGSPLLVEGRLKLDQWYDKQTGQKRSKLGVVVEGFQFLGGGNRGEGGGDTARRPATAPAAAAAPQAAEGPVEPGAPPHEEDDVPF